jgi:two-component system, LytTR family, response regulator
MSIRAIIVDDEDLARRGIRTLLRRWPDVEVVAECANGREAVDAIQEMAPNLVFLDIEMPGKNGFDVMAECQMEHKPYVIFVTAYDRYALKAFDVHALDYVVKPIDEPRFDAALGRARHALAQARDSLVGRRFAMLAETRTLDRITVRSGGRLVVLRIADIDWVEAEQDYVSLHVGPKTYLLRDSIGALAERLASSGFVRVHRSTLLNVERVRELLPLSKGEYTVVLNDGTQHKLSRNYREAIERLTGYGL